MQRDELLTFLTEFTADRLAVLQRHDAGAKVVSHYDFNNTYQYVIGREETHLSWLSTALAEYDVPVPPPSSTFGVPVIGKIKKVEAATFRPILEDDAHQLESFITKWRPRVAHVTHARHRKMLDVILGESAEHARLFAQAAGGFEEVLGKRTAHAERVGGVLPERWQE